MMSGGRLSLKLAALRSVWMRPAWCRPATDRTMQLCVECSADRVACVSAGYGLFWVGVEQVIERVA